MIKPAVPGVMLLLVLTLFAVSASADTVEGWDRYVTPWVDSGRVGSLFLPADSASSRAAIHDPAGFEVHLSPVERFGAEKLLPAGEPVIPPRGRWRVWLEGRGRISPYSRMVVFPSAGRWSKLSTLILPTVRAGRVLAEGDFVGSMGDFDLWLLSATPAAEGRYELSRWGSLSQARQDLWMPAGRTIAGLWDSESERFEALSRPFRVPPGAETEAPLIRPSEFEAMVMAYIERPAETALEGLDALALEVVQGDSSMPPDFYFATQWGAYAIWYRLNPGTAILRGGSAEWYLPSQALDLAGGQVESIDGRLVSRPVMDVQLVLPPALREASLSLSLARLPELTGIQAVELLPDAHNHRFTRLEAGRWELRLDTELGPFRKLVELVDGEHRQVLLEPELILLDGVVRRGGEPVAATLRFTTVPGDSIEVETNEVGIYQATVLQPLRWVDVSLSDAGAGGEPWRDLFSPPLAYSQRLDFDLSEAKITVRVLDRSSGMAIAAAEVAVREEYFPPSESTSERGPRPRVLGRTFRTDDDGEIRLPPPRPGTLQITAVADGYSPTPEPVRVELQDQPLDRTVEVWLEPVENESELQVYLPEGHPAVGAEILIVPDLDGAEVLFAATADESGRVAIPSEPLEGWLLIRHVSAASTVVPRTRINRSEGGAVRLEPSASRNLVVRVVDETGETPQRGAQIVLWLGERRLSGGLLRWLFDAPARSDGNGHWVARKLPARPVRLVAVASPDRPQSLSLEALAVTINNPWPVVQPVAIIH